jgi:hypothetical protein
MHGNVHSYHVNYFPQNFSLISRAIRVLTYYLLAPWNTVLLEKLTGFQLVKKFPTFY